MPEIVILRFRTAQAQTAVQSVNQNPECSGKGLVIKNFLACHREHAFKDVLPLSVNRSWYSFPVLMKGALPTIQTRFWIEQVLPVLYPDNVVTRFKQQIWNGPSRSLTPLIPACGPHPGHGQRPWQHPDPLFTRTMFPSPAIAEEFIKHQMPHPAVEGPADSSNATSTSTRAAQMFDVRPLRFLRRACLFRSLDQIMNTVVVRGSFCRLDRG